MTLVDYAAIEVTASVGKKKGPDAAIPKALRRFVQLADDDRRTGDKLHTKLVLSLITNACACRARNTPLSQESHIWLLQFALRNM